MSKPKISARQIQKSDLPFLAEFLGKGLGYSREYYLAILQRMAERVAPQGFPEFGYVLLNDNVIVGAILLIFSAIREPGACPVRCHVTAWYVEPRFRPFGAIFFSRALNYSGVSYLNISARPTAKPFVELHGFTKYVGGQFLSFPLLSGTGSTTGSEAKVTGFQSSMSILNSQAFERQLLADHATFGCLCIWCVTSERAYPFIFQDRLFKGVLPGVQLIYCPSIDDFVRFVRPIGKFLAMRGRLLVRVDANGPVPGLTGMYLDGMEVRYYKGSKPRIGDLTYTQAVMAPFPRRKI